MTEVTKEFIQKNEDEKIIEIEIERLRSFKNHPFQVRDDNEMHLLKESIEKYGILTPLIVRPVPDGVYEIIAGHRRRHAAELLGYRKVPVIIRVMNEDEAILNMVDSNLHREKISFSEKAFAYKMKNDVLKRKSGRKKGQIDHKTKKKRTVELDDEKMADLVESVKTYGVLTPVLLRSDGENGYEMISGHRRMHAAVIAGLVTIPAIVRELSDDDAVIAMVDANIQREELLPSEKAFAYRMKLDAMKHQGYRTDITSGQNGQKSKGVVSRDILAEQVGESTRNVQRYIRLTELIPELLDMVDVKKLNFTIAVDISYIDKEMQKWIYEYIRDTGFIKPKQITALRKQLEEGPVNQGFMISIFNSCIAVKAPERKVVLSGKKLTKYFPEDYSETDMEKVIEALLEQWKREQE